ncbi:MAG: SpoVG family protein [Clostridia bacterium]|nr:SpoVG family protein [Clostridia bacterium]
MEITDVKVFKLKGKGKLLAVANVVIGNKIVLKGIKVIDGERGMFIAMPSRLDTRFKEAKYREHYHPINQEARDEITSAVIDAYINLEE